LYIIAFVAAGAVIKLPYRNNNYSVALQR